jgi:hypothetical protein
MNDLHSDTSKCFQTLEVLYLVRYNILLYQIKIQANIKRYYCQANGR